MNLDGIQSSSSGYMRRENGNRRVDDEYRPYLPPPPRSEGVLIGQPEPYSALTNHVRRYQQMMNSSHNLNHDPVYQRPVSGHFIPPPPPPYQPQDRRWNGAQYQPNAYIPHQMNAYYPRNGYVPHQASYIHEQRNTYPPPQSTRNAYVPRQSAQPAQRHAFFCAPCSKPFDCEEELEIHVAETHVLCTHPGCTFSGREDLVRAHKVKHAVGEESPEEIAAWVAMRRFRFPKKIVTLGEVAPPVSKLEKHLRASMRAAQRSARAEREARSTQAPCIHWERNGKCKFGDGCGFAHAKSGVCSFFLNHGKCRHGDTCKYSHVRRSSKELAELRDPHGQLLKKLLSPEVSKWEAAVLQVIRFAVNNEFFQNEEELNESDTGYSAMSLSAISDDDDEE